MSNYYDDDFIFYDDSKYDDNMVDISDTGKPSDNKGGNNFSDGQNPKKRGGAHKAGLDKKKKIIIACCAAGVFVIGAVITGICLMLPASPIKDKLPAENSDFKFSDDAVVSGVSIGGKTYSEALELLN
ncbi:MAG: hypothetical protein ACI4RF_05300, partial [Eubacterium sp.]